MGRTMVVRSKAVFLVFQALAAAALLAGCSLSAPDHFSPSPLQLQQDRLAGTLPASQFDEAMVAEMATHFTKHGEGPVDLTVTYDPLSRTATAMNAREEAKRIAFLLRKNGVENVRADILPVTHSGDEMKVMFSYDYYSLLPPEGCEMMPGVKGRTIDAQENYKLGCTVDTLFARQIARPKDLSGQGPGSPATADGRRASNIVDLYRTGAPNKALEGETASDQ